MLPELNNFEDLLNKLKYDRERLSKTSHIYELLDCLLTLNALPEWIENSQNDFVQLKKIAKEKIKMMKDPNFKIDENHLFESIDQKLKLIRLVCNHAKHNKKDNNVIPKILREYDASFPMKFPAKFGFVISIGNRRIDAEFIVDEVTNFWKTEIKNNSH